MISRLLWFCITTLCDWLTKLAPLSQPIVLSPHVFSRARRQLHVFASNSDWFVVLFTSLAIGQYNYLVLVYDTQLETGLQVDEILG